SRPNDDARSNGSEHRLAEHRGRRNGQTERHRLGTKTGNNDSSAGVIAAPANGCSSSGLLLLGCYPSGTYTVRLVIQNPTGGAIDQAGKSGTFWVVPGWAGTRRARWTVASASALDDLTVPSQLHYRDLEQNEPSLRVEAHSVKPMSSRAAHAMSPE